MKNKKIVLIAIVLIIILIAFIWKYFYDKKNDLHIPETWIVKIGNSEYDLDKIWEIQPIKTSWEWFFYDYSWYWYSQEYNYEKQEYETTPEEEKDFHAKWYPLSFWASVYYPMEDLNYSSYNNIYISFHKHKIFNDGWDWWSKIKFHNWFQKFDLDKFSVNARKLEVFSNGVNIEIFSVVERKFIYARVNERGVGETDACGSGALAISSGSLGFGLITPVAATITPIIITAIKSILNL